MEALELLQRIAVAVEKLAGGQQAPKRVTKDEERAALAVVAVAKGCNTFKEIAEEIGVHPSTVSRNPAIRRAVEMSVTDRRFGDAETEDFRYGDFDE